MDEEADLVVEEYKSLRELILENIRIMERNEIYAIGAVAAAAAFDLKLRPLLLLIIFAWTPLLIALLGTLRFYALHGTINTINSYIVAIERRYPKLGYVTFYFNKLPRHQDTSNTTILPQHGLKRSRELLWWCLLAFSLIFAVVMAYAKLLGLANQ